MGRYTAMAALSTSDTSPSDLTGSCDAGKAAGGHGVVRRSVLPPLSPSMDMARYAATENVKIRGFDETMMADAVECARRLWSQTPEKSGSTDVDAVRSVARYLAHEASRRGEFEYKRPFRRANVDAYINLVSQRLTNKSVRTMQWKLHEVGRLLYPREFPEAQSLAAPHTRRCPAASQAEIFDLYALAPTLSPAQSQRLYTVLDLCYGAGARAGDFKVLTGTSITETRWADDVVAVVRLPNQAGGSRLVPVADPVISERLLKLAAQVGTGFLMATTTGEVERNAVNRVGEHLREHGHRSINAAALRNRWVIEVGDRVPAALLMQLADSTTLQILADQRDQLPDYGLQHTIALTKENHG